MIVRVYLDADEKMIEKGLILNVFEIRKRKYEK
jgi:hypothetical protein